MVTGMQQDKTLDELRPELLQAMLPHVAFDGWGEAALKAAAADLHLDFGHARLVFPGGIDAMLSAYLAKADDDMMAAFALANPMAMKVRSRIGHIIRLRLEQAVPHREVVRRTASLLLLPAYVGLGARSLWQTVDHMWRACGDQATDFNYYSKRAILAGVYSTTLAVWLTDESPDFAESWAFLDRRLNDVMRFEKAKAEWREQQAHWPDISLLLGRLRYPAATR